MKKEHIVVTLDPKEETDVYEVEGVGLDGKRVVERLTVPRGKTAETNLVELSRIRLIAS